MSPFRKPFFCCSCGGFAQCRCPSQHDVTSTFPRRKPLGAAQPKEIVVLTREFTHLPHSNLRSVEEQSTVTPADNICCGKAHPDCYCCRCCCCLEK